MRRQNSFSIPHIHHTFKSLDNQYLKCACWNKSQQIVHAGATFESQASVYSSLVKLTRHDCSHTSRISAESVISHQHLEAEREEAWGCMFMLQLVQLYRGMGQLSTQNLYTTPDQTNRRNLEQLCASANLLLSSKSPKWVAHTCKTKGCREGFAVVDGNEKINRPICSAPKSQVFLPQQHIYMTQCCIRSPASGGRFRKPSKYCEMHLFFWKIKLQLPLLTPTCQHHIHLYWKRTRWGPYLTMTVLTSL